MIAFMTRPCFLVVDREYAGSISSRKLVIETAKFNVITVYSAAEAIETLRRFPAVDGIIADVQMPDMPCSQLVQTLKAIKPGLPIIVVSSPTAGSCDGADHWIESFNHKKLLELLQTLKAKESAELQRREDELSQQ